MATSALEPPHTVRALASSARWRTLAFVPALIVLMVSLVELALADRKFGLFTGGFGMSRAVDAPAEIGLFLLAYAVGQGLLGLAVWALALRVTRSGPFWAPVFVFALINGALFVAVLAAQYQLASYFSDAVGFALLKQLGGGSLVDAILFGLSEIGLAAVALAVLGVAAWLAWWMIARFAPASAPRLRDVPRAIPLVVAGGFLTLAVLVPRLGGDAAHGLNRTLAWGALVGSLDLVSDVDRDGYGVFGIQRDNAPFDARRHPLALDVPGNGIDEDGYGGDLVLVPMAEPLRPQTFADTPPHVVVVVFESTRGDVLGKRIGGRPVAPNLEALAARGSAAVAFSHVGFTTESLKSLFSGQLAPRNGDPSLFRDFAASGYRIGVFSGQPEDFGGISGTVGMRDSADIHVDAETLREKRAFDFAAQGSLLVDESHLLAAFDRTLGQGDWSTRPHMAYFNFQSAHFPYDHPGVARTLTQTPVERGAITKANAERVRTTYWNAVANSDRWLGALIARLKARGVWGDTILIVAGDHGEELFESGFLGHGHVINREQFATVLVSNRPNLLPKGPVGLADVRAILAAAVRGVAPPPVRIGPFLHIGPLDAPTAIGLAGAGGELTSVRLDTGEVCYLERGTCVSYAGLAGPARARADAVIARWGSERWRDRQRGH